MNLSLYNVLRELHRQGLSLFPLSMLNAVSVYVDDVYENYDYDIVTPGQREKLVRLLKRQGFRQVTGRVITSADKSVLFELPKPNFTLGDDPASQAQKLIAKSRSTVVITPTQALLIYFKRFKAQIRDELAGNSSKPVITELVDLVYEQPANLDKVREWLGPSGLTDVFISLKYDLRDSQQAGITARREYNFESRIPKRLEQRD